MALSSLPKSPYKLPITATCSTCNKGFYASPGHLRQGWGKYCSILCYNASRGPLKPTEGWLNCKGCGDAFRQKPTSIRNGKAKTYCSSECRSQRVTIVCAWCGNPREVYRSLAHLQHCSQKCLSQSKNQKVVVTCIVCGECVWRKRSYFIKKGSGSFCSTNCKAKHMSQTQLTASGVNRNSARRGGKREDLGGQYFRSGWEANYARYLNWLVSLKQISKWEFEPDTFEFHNIKRGSRFYTPDFKVFENDGSYTYHEVKGWMDPKSQTKLRRMKKYYPLETVILIDRTSYLSLARQVKGAIPNWE